MHKILLLSVCGLALSAAGTMAAPEYYFRLGNHVVGATNPGDGQDDGADDENPGEEVPPDGTPADEEPPTDALDAGPIRFVSVDEVGQGSETASGTIVLAGEKTPAAVFWDTAAMPPLTYGMTATESSGGKTLSLNWQAYGFEGETVDCAMVMNLTPTADPRRVSYDVRMGTGAYDLCVLYTGIGGVGLGGLRAEAPGDPMVYWQSNYVFDRYGSEFSGQLALAVPDTFAFPGTAKTTSDTISIDKDEAGGVSDLGFDLPFARSGYSCGPERKYVCTATISADGKTDVLDIVDASGLTSRVKYVLARIDDRKWTMSLTKSGALDIKWIESPNLAATSTSGNKGAYSPETLDFEVGPRSPKPVFEAGTNPPADEGYALGGGAGDGSTTGPFFEDGLLKAQTANLRIRFTESRAITQRQTFKDDLFPEDASDHTGATNYSGVASPTMNPGSYTLLRTSAPLAYEPEDATGWMPMVPVSGPDDAGWYYYDPSFTFVLAPFNEYGGSGQESDCHGSTSIKGSVSVRAQFADVSGLRDSSTWATTPAMLAQLDRFSSGSTGCLR
jgi:hypothetical protein